MKNFIKSAYVLLPLRDYLSANINYMKSLTVIPADRPSPKELLSHPWLTNIMKKEVNMAQWIREVWNWPRPPPPPQVYV